MKKYVKFILYLVFTIFLSMVSFANEQKLMIGETFCLNGLESKKFYRVPQEIIKVYGYDKNGNEILYSNGVDYTIEDNKTIKRTEQSKIPDFRKHNVEYYENGKFDWCSDPRMPELNVMYQVHIDYKYEIDNVELNAIENASKYLSEDTKRKIINKEKVRINLIGDSIANGAETTAQYFFGDRVKDSFLGLTKETLEKYYGCEVEANLIAADGVDKNFLTKNKDDVVKNNPDIVMIEFGMNDHAGKRSFLSKLKFEMKLKLATKYFKSKGADVIFIGFFQQNEEWVLENRDNTIKYNDVIKNVAKSTKSFYADVYSLFEKVRFEKNLKEDLTVDYMHHSSDWGHQIYLTAILPVFNIDGKMRPIDIPKYVYIKK